MGYIRVCMCVLGEQYGAYNFFHIKMMYHENYCYCEEELERKSQSN